MRSGVREGLELVCPFCRTALARPAQIRIPPSESAQGGACKTCGAIYLFDPTGKNVGEVMMQGLQVAANLLSREVYELVAGEDYEEVILSYDWRTHRSKGEPKQFMDGCGRLYVIKIKKKPE